MRARAEGGERLRRARRQGGEIAQPCFRFSAKLPWPIAPIESHLARVQRVARRVRLLGRLEVGGELFLSNAVIEERYLLRACIVNFRTTYPDLEALIKIVLREGAKLHNELMIEWK